MRKRTLRISGPEAFEYLRALASDKRLEILELLGDKILNIQQISEELGLAQPTVTSHIQRLEEAGLIRTSFQRGQRGTQKACSSLFDEIVVALSNQDNPDRASVLEQSMPLGAYTDFQVQPTCGLAHEESIIGLLDNPAAFDYPERMKAQILWFARGTVEYTFPRALPPKTTVTRFDLSAELCSEVAGWDNAWASDITLWINDIQIGTWTSPGDFGGERGRLNPAWWQDRYSQFGLLKNWSVDERGSYVDGVKLSGITIDRLRLEQGPIRVRLGNREDARHAGGVTLFGMGFGNYRQDLVLRLSYEHLPAQRAQAVEGRGEEANKELVSSS